MNTEIFETMKARSDEYMEKFNELETARQNALDTYGIHSDENSVACKLISDFKEKNQDLYNRGQGIAYRAYDTYKNGYYNDFVVDEFFWNASDIKDFLDTVRKAEIKTFIFTNQSTGLMENIHDLVESGCTLLGTCKVSSNSKYDSSVRLGLMFRVNELEEDDYAE